MATPSGGAELNAPIVHEHDARGLPRPSGGKRRTVDAELEKLQRETFGYFVHETNPANGLVIDKTAPDWPASIAATGLALACYPVGVQRGFMTRAAAVERTLATLRFFWSSRKAPRPTRPGTEASTTTFSTCRQAGALGNASCPPWTVRS